MLDDLLIYVSKHKQDLKDKIVNLKVDAQVETIDDFWISFEPEKKENVKISAEDGSYNYIEYKGFVLYAVTAEGLSFSNNELISEKNVDVDILHPYRHTEERLRFYMSILEKKVALKILEKNETDYILLDGSILGDLIRPAAYERAPSAMEREIIQKRYLTQIKKSFENKEFSSVISKNFVNEIYTKDKASINLVIYLEYLENILSLKELLKYENKVIGISKRSQSTLYFENPFYPDIAIFEYYCRKPGFSKPMSVKIEYLDNYKRRFPILDQEMRDIPITLFYARFGKNSPVLKFEYVGEPDEESVKEIMNGLASSIVEGYPYLLKKAHNEAIIRNKDIEQIARILGIIDKTGREML